MSLIRTLPRSQDSGALRKPPLLFQGKNFLQDSLQTAGGFLSLSADLLKLGPELEAETEVYSPGLAENGNRQTS